MSGPYFQNRPGKVSQNVPEKNSHNTSRKNEAEKLPKEANKRRPINKNIKKSKKPRFVLSKELIYVFAFVVIFFILALCVFLFTNKNSNEVFLNDNSVGIIAFDKETTPKTLLDLVLLKKETEMGTKIKSGDKVTFKEVHSSKKERAKKDSIVSEIFKQLNYEVEASVINVNETPYAIVKNKQEADEVLNKLATKNKISTPTFTNVTITNKFTKLDQLDSLESAYKKLDTNIESTTNYTIKSKDSLQKIANANGVTIDDILRNNEGYDYNSKIVVGKTLKIPTVKPLVTIEGNSLVE